VYDFMASGRLWRDALVMMDRQTRSLWTQHDGHALKGPSAGLTLVPIPSIRTSWATARQGWPDARVLRKKPGILGSGARTMYSRYLSDREAQGIFGTQVEDERLPPKTLIYGTIDDDGQAWAIPAEALDEAAIPSSGVLQYWFSWVQHHPDTRIAVD
jgi:hypothetical protein